jgi:hypothetical protein
MIMGTRPVWIILCSLALAPDAGAQAPGDSAKIRQVIESYVVGWREADVERLSQVLDTEEGVILWPSGAPGAEVLNGLTFGEVLARGRRPNPEYGVKWGILSLDIGDGSMAVAKVDISRSGGSYIDYLVLYKLARRWRIVTKTYVVR